jgi:hypothetical protein
MLPGGVIVNRGSGELYHPARYAVRVSGAEVFAECACDCPAFTDRIAKVHLAKVRAAMTEAS